jgi:hypothetical protein
MSKYPSANEYYKFPSINVEANGLIFATEKYVFTFELDRNSMAMLAPHHGSRLAVTATIALRRGR